MTEFKRLLLTPHYPPGLGWAFKILAPAVRRMRRGQVREFKRLLLGLEMVQCNVCKVMVPVAVAIRQKEVRMAVDSTALVPQTYCPSCYEALCVEGG